MGPVLNLQGNVLPYWDVILIADRQELTVMNLRMIGVYDYKTETLYAQDKRGHPGQPMDLPNPNVPICPMN